MRLLGLLLLLFGTTTARNYYLSYVKNDTYESYHMKIVCAAAIATFGADPYKFAASSNTLGCAVTLSPDDACSTATINIPVGVNCPQMFAFVPRQNQSCSFSQRAYFSQQAGARAMVIVNEDDLLLSDMMGSDEYASKVSIPLYMVSNDCGLLIMEKYSPANGYLTSIDVDGGSSSIVLYAAIPFTFFLVLCACYPCIARSQNNDSSCLAYVCLPFAFCWAKFTDTDCGKKANRKLKSWRYLRKVPTRTFHRGDSQDMCAICQEEFTHGEKIRVLTCNHVFHCKCVDPWLLSHRADGSSCPMCRQPVKGVVPKTSSSTSTPPPATPPNSISIMTTNTAFSWELPDAVEGATRSQRTTTAATAVVEDGIVIQPSTAPGVITQQPTSSETMTEIEL